MHKSFSAHIMSLILSWIAAVCTEFLLLPASVRDISELHGIGEMSLLRVLLLTAVIYLLLLTIPERKLNSRTRRILLLCIFTVYATAAVVSTFTLPFFIVCAAVVLILLFYAVFGWDNSELPEKHLWRERKIYKAVVFIAAAAFFVFLSAWGICRIRSFSTPTFDFGIFAQMFHSMKETGLPLTTVERDGLLSHFAVHISPIYYLMLPFYCIFPRPEILPVLMAATLACSVIPLWKIANHHGLHPMLRTLLCLLLLVYPAFSGGTSYDLHENCFLTPLILWLMYGIDKKSIPITAVTAVLILAVKEDAAVYVAVAAIFLLLRSLLKKDGRGAVAGFVLLGVSVAYFCVVTEYLAKYGDGVMTYRYKNFMPAGETSLSAVIKTVLICPIKALFECVDAEKLEYLGFTLLPLLGLPLFTRRYERYILLIPYMLLNLMSDYVYQHDIMFQYSFGSLAFLFYLTVVSLADIRLNMRKTLAAAAAFCIGFGCFYEVIIPKADRYFTYCRENGEIYSERRKILESVPKGVSIAASTFFTTYFSNRELLYDIRYGSREHILSCEYIVFDPTDEKCLEKFESEEKNALKAFRDFLSDNEYSKIKEADRVEIWQKDGG